MVVSLRASFSDRVRDGFTLLELLAAITVIAILVTLISVGVSKAKKASRSLACKNNLRQQGIWLTEFVSDNGAYPLGSNTNTVRYRITPPHFKGPCAESVDSGTWFRKEMEATYSIVRRDHHHRICNSEKASSIMDTIQMGSWGESATLRWDWAGSAQRMAIFSHRP
jgi:prepilin-type N-terminal cleavage/methylation domain-containing protein